MTETQKAEIAHKISREIWGDNGCATCDNKRYEMHEIYGRQFRKHLGALCCVLGVSDIPQCPVCHKKVENLTLEQQLHIVHTCPKHILLAQKKIDALIAIKSRVY